MATATSGGRYSAAAAADLSAKKYYIVKTDSSGNIVLSALAVNKHLGILMNEPVLGATADVDLVNAPGTGKVIAGGSINKDDYITSDTAGKAVATTTGGDIVIGRALTGASSGDILEFVKMHIKYA